MVVVASHVAGDRAQRRRTHGTVIRLPRPEGQYDLGIYTTSDDGLRVVVFDRGRYCACICQARLPIGAKRNSRDGEPGFDTIQ